MNFDKIDGSIKKNRQAFLQKKLQGLALELGVRHDNQFVGSGLGGNNPQLFALMSFRHKLVDDPSLTIEVKNGSIRWGDVWLENAKRADIRKELDAKLPVAKSLSFQDIQNDAAFASGPNVRSWDTLRDALHACADLASDLDKGVETKVSSTASTLSGLPMEVNLVAIRTQLQIERLVRHNLDEHPDFGKLLTPINKAVDE